ncbi:acyl-CoA thioesterase [Membranicola marinus]|uniref:Acyl-CoA thioesterase n=1 Tax=Membranihabitans marinus TaxID=1227546 RepID=A0A953HSA6_9BACT|nr:thioesterase family protein [Membranihabitans marinus]MBY5956988.1 acyl-CoA thioesterase [Membranihabitans marinus]
MSANTEGVFNVRVRYSETDQMGYVYYGNYARYYEIGRTELMRSLGVHYRSMEEKGIIMPVVSMEVKYLRPATYDDLIEIRTTIKKLDDKMIVFESMIYNEANQLLNRGIVKLCFLDKGSHERISTPSFIRQQII